MEITINFNLSDDDEIELSKIIGVERQELPSAIAPFSVAAIEELVAMFLGKNDLAPIL
jgi:hypothetical protein